MIGGLFEMVEGVATLVVDLGNSETRVRTYFGKSAKGKSRYRFDVLSNRFQRLRKSAAEEGEVESLLKNDAYNAENSAIFRMDGDYYVNGLLCQSEYQGGSIRPSSAGRRKYEDIACKLAIINAFHKGFEMVADMANTGVESLNIKWKIALLLPPEDMEMGAQKIADMVKSIENIDFIMPDMKMNIEFDEGSPINVYPEGFCALVAILFESKGKLRDDYMYLTDPEETTLIIDIGAGTSDLTLANGTKIVTSSRYTANIGGNNVVAIVDDQLRRRSIRLSSKALNKGVETGLVRVGAKSFDISEELRIAKDTVSRELMEEVNKFLERNSLSMQSINNILLCGGGAEESKIEGVNPIADYITDYVKELSEFINVIELPEYVNENGEAVKMSPRHLNIIGAGILSE